MKDVSIVTLRTMHTMKHKVRYGMVYGTKVQRLARWRSLLRVMRISLPSSSANVFTGVCAGLFALSSIACRNDIVFTPLPPVETLYWDLRVNHGAVQLSTTPPYDTVQLQAIPYTADDQIWTFTGDSTDRPQSTTTWVSADASKVSVSADGLLTARAPTAAVNIMVTRQIGTVTHKDTIRVQVNTLTNPPVLTKFAIRPTDSLKRAMSILPMTLPLVIRDNNDAPIAGLPVVYSSSDSTIARFSIKWNNSMGIPASLGGPVLITASTYAYGVSMTDTFTLEVGWWISLAIGQPAVAQMAVPGSPPVFNLKASRQDIGPGGSVYWENSSGQRPTDFTGTLLPFVSMDVLFDNPTDVLEAVGSNASGAGNILNIPGDSVLSVTNRRRYRRFAKPGEYRYTIQPFGFRGVVVVHDR